MIKFSIIILVYNTEKYLKKCLDSVVNQSFSDFEIVIVNDGSTDNSSKIIDEYSNKYSFIKIINKKNTGVADSRNIGIENSSRTICCVCG